MQKNKTDIADLLADESFINYCMNSPVEDVTFWENYIKENPGQRELAELARERFLLLFNVLAESDREEQAARLKSKLNQKEAAPVINMIEHREGRGRRIFSVWKISAAALVLLVAGLSAVLYFGTGKEKTIKRFITSYGERKNIQLPDGSLVNLNAGSKIEIDESFGIKGRHIYLEGEAFFDVKHNEKKPFIVHTPAMDVKALGTAFNVKAYHEEMLTETSLIRGLVEVTLKENDNRVLVLRPDQKIAWEHRKASSNNASLTDSDKNNNTHASDGIPKKLKVTDHGDIKEIAWKENKLVFEDDSLNDIVALLERWYGAKIKFKDETIRNYRFTGVFEKEDLRTLLEFLKESRSFNFKIDPGEETSVLLSK